MKVDEMVAGFEIDLLAVVKVMGESDWPTAPNWYQELSDGWLCLGGEARANDVLPKYSKYLSFAWELIKKLPGTGSVQKSYGGKYACYLHSGTEENHAGFMTMSTADTPALAIVRAALKGMGVK